MADVKAFHFIFAALFFAASVGAQQNPAKSSAVETPDEILRSAEQWAKENLDDSVLKALKQVDHDRVRGAIAAVQEQFQGTNIYRLAALKQTATRALPVLQQFEETQPLASWLRTHLDYLDTAEELQREVSVTPARPGGYVEPPAPQAERNLWNQTLDKRPLPPLAKEYVPRLKQVFAAEGVPPELVWVAEVESSFDARARSPVGAAGMFQLMPETARSEGLSTWPRDERLQPDKSAHAAARFLRELHHHFDDWRLALAAYNAGEARVDGLLKNSRTRSFDAIAYRLPAETQMYVPKVEATLHRREGLTLAELKTPGG